VSPRHDSPQHGNLRPERSPHVWDASARARMPCRPVRGKGQRRLADGVTHVKLTEPASKPLLGTAAAAPAWPGRLRSAVAARVRSGGRGLFRGPGGSRWRASPESASWRCSGLCTGAATRPVLCLCWTPPKPPITTGWPGRSANCFKHGGAWSSGTSTASAPYGYTHCGSHSDPNPQVKR